MQLGRDLGVGRLVLERDHGHGLDVTGQAAPAGKRVEAGREAEEGERDETSDARSLHRTADPAVAGVRRG